MYVRKSWRVIFVCLLTFVVHLQFASDIYAMVSDTCLQNPAACVDDQTDADTSSDSASVNVGALDYIKVLFALVFVVALLLFVLRFLGKKSKSYQQNALIQNLGGHSVGPQKSVQVLQIGGKVYIVGVGDDVQLLDAIENPQEVRQLIEDYNDKFSNTSTTPYIAEIVSKFRKKEPIQTQSEDFSNVLDERLAQIKKQRSHELERWKEKESNQDE